MLAQLFENSIILKYSAEPKGATAYLKTLYFPYAYTSIRASMWGLGLISIVNRKLYGVRYQIVYLQKKRNPFK